MTSNNDIARQHFEHFHPEFAPVRRYELERHLRMIEQLHYRFTCRKRLLERPTDQFIPTQADIRAANNLVIDRMCKELELTEDSTITNLRHAVMKLAD